MVRVIINMKAEGTATMHTFPTDLGGKTCGIRSEDEQDDWLGASDNEDEGGEGGDAKDQEDLVPQATQLTQAWVLPVQQQVI